MHNPLCTVDKNVHNTLVTGLDNGSIMWLNCGYHYFSLPSDALAIALRPGFCAK